MKSGWQHVLLAAALVAATAGADTVYLKNGVEFDGVVTPVPDNPGIFNVTAGERSLVYRAEEIDRVVGFEVGADDYVTKPFSVRELMLRVRAILRRAPAKPIEPDDGQMLTIGPLRLDVAAHRVWVEQEELPLTATEFKLLYTLVHRAGRVQSRGQLLQDVWEMPPDLNTRTVDTHVKRLREKLGVAAGLVETVRGVGYRVSR